MFHALKPLDCSLTPRPRAKIFFRSLAIAAFASVMFYGVSAGAEDAPQTATAAAPATAKPDCKKSALTQEKFVEMMHAIITHGDLTDIAFIEKTLEVKFKEIADPDLKGFHNAHIPGTQIFVVLSLPPERTELDFHHLDKIVANFQDCGYLTKEKFNQVFGGSFNEDAITLDSNSGGRMHMSGFLIDASQDMKGKNDTIMSVRYMRKDKSSIISSAKIWQRHEPLPEGK